LNEQIFNDFRFFKSSLQDGCFLKSVISFACNPHLLALKRLQK
jgi:hypothetical protein